MNRVHTSHELYISIWVTSHQLYICVWVTNSTYVYESRMCVYMCESEKCVTGMHPKARWIVFIRVTNSIYVYELRTLHMYMSHQLYICIWFTNSTYVYESQTVHMYMSHVCVYTCVNIKECVTGMHPKARWIVCIKVTNSTYVHIRHESPTVHIYIWVTNSRIVRRVGDSNAWGGVYESRTVHTYMSNELSNRV